MRSLLDDLNPRQREAVCHTEGPLLILAGAGSGKTRVITYRIAYLIGEKDVFPGSILAVTFTNKAANEMRERVAGLVGPWARSVHISTFHSFCVRVLRCDIDRLGMTRDFTIFDASDQQAAVKQALHDLNINDKQFTPAGVLGTISNAKNELVRPADFAEAATGFYEKTVARIYGAYQSILQKNNALDFDDLLMETVELFRGFPEVLGGYQEKFKYIMVDEYQDTNRAQYVIVRLLAARHRNLCVVGDEDQSIYGWRGADIRNILDFEEDYPDARVIKLEENYRSTRAILEAANEVIKNNRERKDKALWTRNPGGELIRCFAAADQHEEARFVANEILRERSEMGRGYKDFVVLYRMNAQSRVFEDVFMSLGIPYKIVGGLRFYERKEIKDIIAYLRLILNPGDGVSLQRVINVPKRGIGDITIERLAAFARQEDIGMFEAMRRAGEIEAIPERTRTQVSRFAGMIEELVAKRDELSPTMLVNEVLERTGYLRELEAERTVEALARIENIKELLSVTREFEARQSASGGEGSLAAFLEEVALISDIDTLKEDEEGVTLMTLHSAKGLEFPVVFIAGMEEGLFPHARALMDDGELEEERRLCYVGITRAMEQLYLTRARKRMIYGESSDTLPSRFLAEIPVDLVVDWPGSTGAGEGAYAHVDSAGSASAAGSAGSADSINPVDLNSPASSARSTDARRAFRSGDKVRHEKLGHGTVVSIEGEGEDAILTIAFPGLGVKKFMLGYAPIHHAG
ncbi:MAG: DNA helicase PcrA [Firmicutes bacterium]|nr:DNA helicase PcrA [Bacillota bacterium]